MSDLNTRAPESAGITSEDSRRIREACAYMRSWATAEALTDVLPLDAPPGVIESIASNCELDHVGVLIFSSSADVRSHLRRHGFEPHDPIASSVVRDRLAARYHVPEHRLADGRLDVQIIHARLRNSDRGVEVFCVDPDDELTALALRNERLGQHETHVAVRLTQPDGRRLEALRRELTQPAGPWPDGGGYNPDHGDDGATVLYFRSRGLTNRGWPRRLEIITAGHHAGVLRRHLASSTNGGRSNADPDAGALGHQPDPVGSEDAADTADAEAPSATGTGTGTIPDDAESRRLLQLLTGAWATQVLRAMVVLDIPDHLVTAGPLTCEELAIRTGADPDRLARLLRALAHPWIGAVQAIGQNFAVTSLGWRLSRESTRSMRHLAIMYGDLFYFSFAALADGVRDAEVQPFTSVYGHAPFEYLQTHPRQSQIFARAMAEGSVFFRDVATAVDLSPARTVADIGGGSGELLAHLCDTYPRLHGMLLEQPDVIAAARVNLGARNLADRCTFFPGDFTVSSDLPPAADVYVLARILHDWDDQTCLSILRAIRETAADDSTLLVIERPLPDDPADPSVAAMWDINMLVNNVGGRERSSEQYRALLGEAGFLVVGERHLPLDMAVTLACPAVPDTADDSFAPAGLFKYAR